jgi:hypothetical protein
VNPPSLQSPSVMSASLSLRICLLRLDAIEN